VSQQLEQEARVGVRAKTGVIGAALLIGVLAACGGGSSGLPRTQANVTVCKILAAYLAGTKSVQQLAGSVLETNAPISHQLRQDVAQFAVTMASAGADAAQQARNQAKHDCQSIAS
jgi:hypothetical protein